MSEPGSGVTRNIAALIATVMPVWMPSHRRRRPESSDRAPVTGAMSAMSRPAAARPQPSHDEWSARTESRAACAGPPTVPAATSASAASTTLASTNASDVSQRVKTNVVMTALNAAEPQSHSAQATTLRAGTGVVRVSSATWVASKVMVGS